MAKKFLGQFTKLLRNGVFFYENVIRVFFANSLCSFCQMFESVVFELLENEIDNSTGLYILHTKLFSFPPPCPLAENFLKLI